VPPVLDEIALTSGNVNAILDEEAGGNPAQSRYCDTASVVGNGHER